MVRLIEPISCPLSNVCEFLYLERILEKFGITLMKRNLVLSSYKTYTKLTVVK